LAEGEAAHDLVAPKHAVTRTQIANHEKNNCDGGDAEAVGYGQTGALPVTELLSDFAIKLLAFKICTWLLLSNAVR